MTTRKATPEQWAQVERFVEDCGYDACLLELRDRIEQLEGYLSKDLESEDDYEQFIAEHEEWRPVTGYEGYYMISSLGRVKSKDRVIPHQRTGTRFIGGKILKTRPNPGGYQMLILCKENKKESKMVHALVADAFLGSKPPGMMVCHGPGGKSDNRVDNLYYGTAETNNGADKRRDGTIIVGERHYKSKLTDQDVVAIRNSDAKGRSLASLYGVSEQCISDIRNNRRWKHVCVECLEEAAANRRVILDDSPAPAGGLVERVKAAIAFEREEISPEYGYEARAAIRVVAEHIRQIGCLNSNAIAQWLEMEAAE